MKMAIADRRFAALAFKPMPKDRHRRILNAKRFAMLRFRNQIEKASTK